METSASMLTLQIVTVAVRRVGSLFLVAALAFDVGCPRLAQAATVSTLGDWAAFFINMGQGAFLKPAQVSRC